MGAILGLQPSFVVDIDIRRDSTSSLAVGMERTETEQWGRVQTKIENYRRPRMKDMAV